MASIEITGGRIYLELDGVTQDGYYNQFYTALAAATNLSMREAKDVKILMPDHVVRYKPMASAPAPNDYFLLDNQEATLSGVWQESSVAGFIGTNAVYTSDGVASFSLASETPGVYEIEAHITASNLRTTRAVYEINDQRAEINQQTQGGWQTLFETALDANTETPLYIVRGASDGSLVVDAIRYRLIREIETPVDPPVETKTVRIYWDQATSDGELITPSQYVLRITGESGEPDLVYVPGTDLEYMVDLPAGDYSVEVAAINRGGQSEWSPTRTMEL